MGDKRTGAWSRRRDHSSSETKDVSRSLSQQLLESERRWSSHLQATLNEWAKILDRFFKNFFLHKHQHTSGHVQRWIRITILQRRPFKMNLPHWLFFVIVNWMCFLLFCVCVCLSLCFSWRDRGVHCIFLIFYFFFK